MSCDICARPHTVPDKGWIKLGGNYCRWHHPDYLVTRIKAWIVRCWEAI